MLTGSYVPGDLGFDPLGLYTIFGKSESGKMLMETAEIKNGRLAMLAITIYALEEAITKNPVVQNSRLPRPPAKRSPAPRAAARRPTNYSRAGAFLFEPFWKTVENLMMYSPAPYSQ